MACWQTGLALGDRGLLLAIVSGVLVFVPDPARYAANYAFRTKMMALCAAVAFS